MAPPWTQGRILGPSPSSCPRMWAWVSAPTGILGTVQHDKSLGTPAHQVLHQTGQDAVGTMSSADKVGSVWDQGGISLTDGNVRGC